LEREAGNPCIGAVSVAHRRCAGYTLTAHRRYRLQRRGSSDINALFTIICGMRQIKSFVREREEHARFNRASDQTAARHAGGDAGMGYLLAVDVDV